MSRREKFLLYVLLAVLAFSFGLERVAEAVNPAVGANGIVWTRLSTDVCPSSGATCTRADSSGNLIEKHDTDTWYVVAVSPAPSVTGYVPTWNQTDHKWYLSAGSGGLSIGGPVSGGNAKDVLYVDGSANLGQDDNLTYDASSKYLLLEEHGAGNGIQVSDNITGYVTNLYGDFISIQTPAIGATPLGGASGGAFSVGSVPFQLYNVQAATVGAPFQTSPDAAYVGRCWDGSTSQRCGVDWANESGSTGSSSYYAKQCVRGVRASTLTSDIACFGGDGTNVYAMFPGAKIGVDATHQNTIPTVNGDTFDLIGTAQTLSNKTLTTPVINGATSASGNFDLSGSNGTWNPPTGGLAADLLFSSDGSNSIGADAASRPKDVFIKEFVALQGITSGSAPSNSSSGTARCYYNSSVGAVDCSLNAANYTPMLRSSTTGGFTPGKVPYADTATTVHDSPIAIAGVGVDYVNITGLHNNDNSFTMTSAGSVTLAYFPATAEADWGTTTNHPLGFFTNNGAVQLRLETDGKFTFFASTASASASSSSALRYNNTSKLMEISNNSGAFGTVHISQASAKDVASSGAGPQSTTITSFTPPVSGIYRISAVCSATTTDTVTVVATYTDAVNTTAETENLLNAVVIATNDTSSGVILARANTSTNIVAKITVSGQSTTKCGAVISQEM